MKYNPKWLKLITLLAPGVTIASCMTDMRDAALTGTMDAVSGTITGTATAALPLADFISRVWAVIFTNLGL